MTVLSQCWENVFIFHSNTKKQQRWNCGLTDLITVLTFFSSKVDLSNIHILFVLVLSLPRFQIQYSNQNLAVERKVMRLRLATLTVGKKRPVCSGW